MKEPYLDSPFCKALCPEPIIDEYSGLITLYWKAWELAWDHISTCPGSAQSPFMDEGFANDRIWIWDTCFMVHFCKYAPEYFPGIQSLDNFYSTMYDNYHLALKIQHPDNPPLFAWTEYEYFKFTGDSSRIINIIKNKQYLQKHFEFIDKAKRSTKPHYAICEMTAQKETIGFRWTGCPSGMDNTPRGRGDYNSILWLDLISQQALSAECISLLAKVINEKSIAEQYEEIHLELLNMINNNYWDEVDECYYDITANSPHDFVKVVTPASFWPMLAGVTNDCKAGCLERLALNPDILGGNIPWPSVSRNDIDFHPDGMYWRGGVWLPTAYMATKALNRYGRYQTSSTLALHLLVHMQKTFEQNSPHTIWECYSPTKSEPAVVNTDNKQCRKDFCGWSALGPISMLIEDVLGFYNVDAGKNEVHWNLHLTARHGIKRLKFGDIQTDILYENNQININSNKRYKLIINGNCHEINEGFTLIKFRNEAVER